MSRGPFTFLEFFAGAGMARLGLGEGWRPLFANDIDPAKAAVYRANFGADDLTLADIWSLSAADLPGRADLAWASSPCQDFSLAGGRAGLAGGRSSALMGFWRLIEALNAEGRAPTMVVIENVVGLMTSHGGRDFAAVCAAMAREGYRFGAVEIDAARFLPQSRRRVFLIGARGAAAAFSESGGGDGGGSETAGVRRARESLPADLRARWIAWPTPGDGPTGGRNTDLAAILEPDAAVRWHSADETARLLALMDPRHLAKVAEARAAAARDGARRVGTVFRRVRAGRQRAEARFDGLAGCLRTPRGGSSRQSLLVVDADRTRSRLVSPREAARLMGLPESYGLPGGVTAALQAAGDGVAVPVVRWLAEQVLEPALRGEVGGGVAAPAKDAHLSKGAELPEGAELPKGAWAA